MGFVKCRNECYGIFAILALLDIFADGDVREILEDVDMRIATYIQKNYPHLW